MNTDSAKKASKSTGSLGCVGSVGLVVGSVGLVVGSVGRVVGSVGRVVGSVGLVVGSVGFVVGSVGCVVLDEVLWTPVGPVVGFWGSGSICKTTATTHNTSKITPKKAAMGTSGLLRRLRRR